MTAVRVHRVSLDEIRNFAVVDTRIAGDLLCLDHDSILKALRKGDIPGFKIGNVWRIPVPQLLRMLDGDRPQEPVAA
jgi:hypothetical protein